jgi:hypothetical protein
MRMKSGFWRSAVVVGAIATSGVSAAAAGAGQQGPTTVRVTAERANVRQSASATSQIIATVERGEVLNLVGSLPIGSVLGSWYRVRLVPSNREGFILANAVEPIRTGNAGRTPSVPSDAAPGPGPSGSATPPSTAQARRPATQPAAPQPFGARAFVGADVHAPQARNTFEAILGTTTLFGFTAGADVYGGSMPKGLFVRVGLSSFSAKGERVFVVEDESFGTGIPVTIKMLPVQVGAGFRPPASASARVIPYVGATAVFLNYQEVSDLADEGENDAERFTGYSLLAGVDVRVARFVTAGVEAEFRQIAGFGKSGASEAFGEDQFGGLSVKFLLGFGR